MKSVGWLIVIVVVAAALRLWQLGELPPGLYHDEAYNGLDALALLDGRPFPIFHEAWEQYAPPSDQTTHFPLFFEGNFGREPAHVYLMALSVKLFGATPFALRLVPALAGIIGTVTVWMVGRQLSDQNDEDDHLSPLYAALTFAILFPTIHFSRFALRTMLFVPIEMLAVYAFLRARKTKSIGWYVVAGLLVGAGLYVYAAGRVFPLVFVLFVVVRGRSFYRRGAESAEFSVFRFPFTIFRSLFNRKWRTVVRFVVMGAAAILIALPLLNYFWHNPYFFSARMAYVATHGAGVEERQWLTVLYNVGRTIRGLYWQGETHLRHNLPGRPILDLIQAMLFTIGLLRAYMGRKHEKNQFVLIWLGVMLLPTILSGDAPHFGRMMGAMPPIAILVGWGSAWVARGAKEILPPLFILSLVLVSRSYFNHYANHPNLPNGSYPTSEGFYAADWALGQSISAQPDETMMYLAPPQQDMATLLFAVNSVTNEQKLRSFAGDGALPLGVAGQDVVYWVRPSATQLIERLERIGRHEIVAADEHVVQIRGVTAESAVSRPFNEVLALDGAIILERNGQIVVHLRWTTAAELPPLTAFVHAIGADGQLIAQDDHPPRGYPTTDWRPGESIIDQFTFPVPAEPTWALHTGWYNSETMIRYGETIIVERR